MTAEGETVFVLHQEWPPAKAPCDGFSVDGVFTTAEAAIVYLFTYLVSPRKYSRPNFKPFGPHGGWSVWLWDDDGDDGSEYIVSAFTVSGPEPAP